MQTLAQMKAEIYNALTNDSTMEGYVGSRVYWLGKVSGKSTFPLIDYKAFDEIGTYSFGGSGISYDGSEATFQIDVYTGPDDVATMDNIIERLKTLMHGLGYRLINSPIEFVDAEVNKIVRPTRWEKWNV
jgi:hypothetical protein